MVIKLISNQIFMVAECRARSKNRQNLILCPPFWNRNKYGRPLETESKMNGFCWEIYVIMVSYKTFKTPNFEEMLEVWKSEIRSQWLTIETGRFAVLKLR